MEKYEIIKDLGAGCFGVAKLCRDKDTSELVAIKFIERGPTIDENVKREIINHRLLRHPNVIRFKQVILTPTHLALVMEYASGGELFERISEWGRFTEDEARYYFRQLIFGVNYIHSMQICHRDLKLDNILLDGMKSPRLKICDFGYSKRISHRALKWKFIMLDERKSSEMKNCDSDCFKQIFHGDLMLQSILPYGILALKSKKTWPKDLMLDSILLDGCPAPQSLKAQSFIQQIRDRVMTQNNILSDGSPTLQMEQLCNKDMMLNSTLSDGRPASQIKQICNKVMMVNSILSDGRPASRIKQICNKVTVVKSIHSDGRSASQIKQISNKVVMVNNILSDGKQASQIKQICNGDLMLDNSVSDGSPTPQLNQICNKDLMLDNDNTLSDGTQTLTPVQLKMCDFGFSKSLHPKPNTNVGSATYTAPEVLSGKGYNGKIADVWSCGVTLYVMLFAAYPFDDPEDDCENSEKTIKRVMSGGYKIPDCVPISKDCQDLLSRIFVRNPSKRISVKGIMRHRWFSKNVQSELTEPTQELSCQSDNSTLSHQSVEEIKKIVREARKQVAPLSTATMGYESNTEEDHDTKLKEEEEDEFV